MPDPTNPILPSDDTGHITLHGDDLVQAIIAKADLTLFLDDHSDFISHEWYEKSVKARAKAGVTQHFAEYPPEDISYIEEHLEKYKVLQLRHMNEGLINGTEIIDQLNNIEDNLFTNPNFEIRADITRSARAHFFEYLSMKLRGIAVIASDVDYLRKGPDVPEGLSRKGYQDLAIELFEKIKKYDRGYPSLSFDGLDVNDLKECVEQLNEDFNTLNLPNLRETANEPAANKIAIEIDQKFKATARWGGNHGYNFKKSKLAKPIDLDEMLEARGVSVTTMQVFGREAYFEAFVHDVRTGGIIDPPDIIILAADGYGKERVYDTQKYIAHLNQTFPLVEQDLHDQNRYISLLRSFKWSDKIESQYDDVIGQSLRQQGYSDFEAKLSDILWGELLDDGVIDKKEFKKIQRLIKKSKQITEETSLRADYDANKGDITFSMNDDSGHVLTSTLQSKYTPK